MKNVTCTAIVFSLITTTAAFAQPEPAKPGFLPEYNYQVAELASMQEAQALMNIETKDTAKNSVCANRAELWTYDMYRYRHLQVGKVFIHFTPRGQADENGEWAYHVAPYVIVDGQEIVLDSGFGEFKFHPTTMTHWMKYFGKSDQCQVLDPVNNSTHLRLEQYDMPNDWVLPKDFKGGNARQYPTPEGSNCYVRKVPMYYQFPVDVYGADLYLSGQKDEANYYRTTFDMDDVLEACKQATNISFKIDHRCKDYLGIQDKPKPKKH